MRFFKSLILLLSFVMMTLVFIIPALWVLLYKQYISYQQGEWLLRRMRYGFFMVHDRIFWHPKRFEMIWHSPKLSLEPSSVLLISNHQCFLDSHVLMTLSQKHFGDFRFLMKDSLKWLPFWGWYTWLNNFPFIKRHHGQYAQRASRGMANFIKKTRSSFRDAQHFPTAWICYPEGTRYQSGKDKALGVLNPKSGGFRTLLSQFSGQVNCLDITLKYHPKVPSYLDVFWGEGYRIEIWVEQHQLSSSMTPQEIRLWLQERWKFKQDRVQNNV